mgnify:CR=1 FL=1
MPTINLAEILTSDPPTPDWVVERFIPRDTITVLIGLEGIGKSSLSYSLALAVATGTPFLGRPTQQLKVLYFDNENSHPDCSQYLRRLWIGMGCPDPAELDKFLQVEHFSLSVGWQKVFAAKCREWNPGLVIVDTANACVSIKDENSNAEAGEILSFVQIARPARASVILMKHEREPKDGMGKSVRGAKYWLGAVDQVVYLHRQQGRPSGTTPIGTDRPERMHRTKLIPAKHRAFGLDEPINITPKELDTPSGKGLIFHGG